MYLYIYIYSIFMYIRTNRYIYISLKIFKVRSFLCFPALLFFRLLLHIVAHLASPGHWNCPRSCRSTGPKYLGTAKSRCLCRWCASPQKPAGEMWCCHAVRATLRWHTVKHIRTLDLKEENDRTLDIEWSIGTWTGWISFHQHQETQGLDRS